MTETILRPAVDRAEAARARAEALTRGAVGAVAQRAAHRGAPDGAAARSLAFPAQLRAKLVTKNGQQRYHLSGIASVTDTPYEMYDMFGPYDEIVEHGAFDVTLAADPDVAFLVNHRGVTMARTRSGTLELAMVDEGLGSEAWLNPSRQDVTDLVTAIEDRDVDQMSFAFMLVEGWWSDDFSTFKITQTDLDRGDVSAVNYGANPYTSIAARSREVLTDLDHMPLALARAAMARLASRADFAPVSTPVVQPEPQSDGARLTGRSVSTLDAWLATVDARKGY